MGLFTTDITADSVGERADFTAISKTLTFQGNNYDPLKRIEVAVVNDDIVENTERLRVTLQNQYADTPDSYHLDCGLVHGRIGCAGLAPSQGQVTILDQDTTVLRMSSDEPHYLLYTVVESGPLSYRDVEIKCGEGQEYVVKTVLESDGVAKFDHTIGPALVDYDFAVVNMTRGIRRPYPLIQSAVDAVAEMGLDVEMICHPVIDSDRQWSAYEKCPGQIQMRGDPEICLVGAVHAAHYPHDFTEFSETLRFDPLSTGEPAEQYRGDEVIEIIDDDLPDQYDKTEADHYATKVFEVNLMRNGVQEDVRMHNTITQFHIIDDDPAFVVPGIDVGIGPAACDVDDPPPECIDAKRPQAFVLGDHISIPVSLSHRIPKDAEIDYTWALTTRLTGTQTATEILSSGTLVIPAEQVRGNILVDLDDDDTTREGSRSLSLSLVDHHDETVRNGAIRLDGPRMYVIGETVENHPRLAKTVVANDYELVDRNPVISAANAGDIEWISNHSVEFEFVLGRPSRHYFYVDYSIFVGGGVAQSDGSTEPNKTGTIRFRTRDTGYTLVYRGSADELKGKTIQVMLRMQSRGYVDTGSGEPGKTGSFFYLVKEDEDEEDGDYSNPEDPEDPATDKPPDKGDPERKPDCKPSNLIGHETIWCEAPKGSGNWSSATCPIYGLGAGCRYYNRDGDGVFQSAKPVYWVRECVPSGSGGYDQASKTYRYDC